MQRIFNKDGFNWWIGVVEDRMDPEKLGRCRVRIFGYHTDSKIILPTKELPWATPIQPITSAAISGIGSSPLGPVEGTWVIGFFLDGEDMQQPAIFGTISTKAAKRAFSEQEEKPPVSNPNDGILRDSSGNPVLDGQGEPIRSGTPSVEGWEIGQTSEKYESGGKGAGTINPYQSSAGGDLGGASYGTYQLASFLPATMTTGKARPSAKNSPVMQFLNTSKFKDKFAGLEPATAAFDAKWAEIASSFKEAFKKEQHDYIQKKYYEVAIANLQRQGLDMVKYGPAVQDLIWSGAVQFGPANTRAFTEALRDKSTLTDKDIVTLVSEWKINNVDTLFKSSSDSIRAGVKSRFQSEKQALLSLIK
jgi:type VI secretion system secreted protein VgrG